MRILVTGGLGFIGSNFVRLLRNIKCLLRRWRGNQIKTLFIIFIQSRCRVTSRFSVQRH